MTQTLSAPGPAQLDRVASYRLRLASSGLELHAVQSLRFEVFNLELNEGLGESFLTGRDEDAFDPYCDHLYVEETATGRPVGTYRLQTGQTAALHAGYYSEQEFDFSPFEDRRSEIIELGRACVHASHRTLGVLNLLWRGVAAYAVARGGRYLVGCSSIPTLDSDIAQALHRQLAVRHLAPPAWRTRPTARFACPPSTREPGVAPVPPRLLRGYLTAGASICGEPAIDRAFGTTDFLTVLDLHSMRGSHRNHFLRSDDAAAAAVSPAPIR